MTRFTVSNKVRRVAAGKELLISQMKMLNDSGDDETPFKNKKRKEDDEDSYLFARPHRSMWHMSGA